jgi:tetratricopeptide (TPR) repeat protein
MIGRERELAALRGAADTVRRGAGQIACVIAEAGLGKSRLVSELRRQLEADGTLSEVDWMEGRALSFQSQTPLAPFVDLFARAFGIDAAAGDDVRLSTLRAALEAAVPDAAADLLPCFGSLLGIPLPSDVGKRLEYLEPPALRQVTYEAVVRFVEAKASMAPMVLVFEDLHWADSSSLELVQLLMDSAERSMLLLVGVFRPRRDEASWKLHEVASREYAHRYLELSLQPLSPERSRELVQNLLWIEGLPESLRQLIVDKCDGNPFFVEEVIRSLIDAGLVVQDGEHWKATAEVDTLKVPDTLAGVLTTRLDGLGDTPKRVAQTASVLGRELEWDLLASIFEPFDALTDAVALLQKKGIVRDKARLPRRVLEFKHALTREAAYESMLLKTRRALHRKAAEAYEKIAPERVGDVATHFLEARENALALPWVVKAGDRAAKAYATPEALRWYQQALDILEAAPDLPTSRHVLEARGTVLSLAMDAEGALENYERLRALGDAEGDLETIASALNKKAMVHLMQMGDMDGAVELLDEAEGFAQAASAPACLAEGSMIRCSVHTNRAEFDTAYQFLDRAARLGAELQAEEPLLFGLVHITNTLIYMTEYDRAWDKAMEAKQLAEARGNLRWLCEVRTFGEPSCLVRSGDIDGALAALTEGVEMAERIGQFSALAVGSVLEGQLRTLRGDLEGAIECNQRAVASATRSQLPFIKSWALCTMGTTYLQVSEKLHGMALEKHEQARELMAGPWGSTLAAMNWCELGFCCLTFGKDEDALALFQRGLTEPSPPMRMVKPQLHIGAATVHLKRGERDEARRHAGEGRTFAESRGMRQFLPFSHLLDARLARAGGELERALELAREAERQAEALGFRPARAQALMEAAGVLRDLGRAADADFEAQRASGVIDDIAGGFRDAALSEMYVRHARTTLGLV